MCVSENIYVYIFFVTPQPNQVAMGKIFQNLFSAYVSRTITCGVRRSRDITRQFSCDRAAEVGFLP